MATTVYWIRLPEHTDIFSEGYVGVTAFLEKRLRSHKHRFKQIWHKLIVEKVLVSSTEYCFDIEQKLRPDRCIGWNRSMGGNKNNVMLNSDNPNFGKFGDESSNYKGKYITPKGEFFDANVAAKHFGVNQTTIIRRCKGRTVNGKTYSPFEGWAFVPEGRVKS